MLSADSRDREGSLPGSGFSVCADSCRPVAMFRARCGVRRIDAPEALRHLRECPVAAALGAPRAAVACLRLLVQSLRMLRERAKEVRRCMDEPVARVAAEEDMPGIEEGRDLAILKSLPGTDGIVLAALLAETRGFQPAGTAMPCACCSASLRHPRQSGKNRIALCRLVALRHLGGVICDQARVAVQHDPASKEEYWVLRERGHACAWALRGAGG